MPEQPKPPPSPAQPPTPSEARAAAGAMDDIAQALAAAAARGGAT